MKVGVTSLDAEGRGLDLISAGAVRHQERRDPNLRRITVSLISGPFKRLPISGISTCTLEGVEGRFLMLIPNQRCWNRCSWPISSIAVNG